MEIEKQFEDYLKPLFGDMAPITIQIQKDRLDLKDKGKLSREDYLKVIESIHFLCNEMAGKPIAEKIRGGLLEILEKEYAQGRGV